MKNQLNIIILFIIALTSCKKETNEKPIENTITTESWKMLDDSIIAVTDRNILTASTSYNKLFFQTPSVFYEIDSNIKLKNAWVMGPDFDNGSMKPFIGKNYVLYFDNPQPQYIEIFYKNDIHSRSRTSINLKDNEFNNYYRQNSFSNLDDQNNFCHSFLSGPSNLDTCTFYINKYHLRTDFYSDCDLLFSKAIMRDFNLNVSNIHLIDDIIYYNLDGLGFRYQSSNGQIDTLEFNLRKMLKINDVIYATSQFSGYKGIARNPSLYCSFDNGKNWQIIGSGGSFGFANNLSNVGGKLVASSALWAICLDFTSNSIKTINTKDLRAQIKTITEFNNKVYIGTDAGVYYKSLSGFFND